MIYCTVQPDLKLAGKDHSAASRNRSRTCPQITQINADTEKECFICVRLRVLQAKTSSLVPCVPSQLNTFQFLRI